MAKISEALRRYVEMLEGDARQGLESLGAQLDQEAANFQRRISCLKKQYERYLPKEFEVVKSVAMVVNRYGVGAVFKVVETGDILVRPIEPGEQPAEYGLEVIGVYDKNVDFEQLYLDLFIST